MWSTAVLAAFLSAALTCKDHAQSSHWRFDDLQLVPHIHWVTTIYKSIQTFLFLVSIWDKLWERDKRVTQLGLCNVTWKCVDVIEEFFTENMEIAVRWQMYSETWCQPWLLLYVASAPFVGFQWHLFSIHGPRRKKASSLGSWENHLVTFPTISSGLGTLKGTDARASLFCLSFSVCPSPSFFLDQKPGHSGSLGVLIVFFLCLFFENIHANSYRNLIWTVNILLFLIWAVIPSWYLHSNIYDPLQPSMFIHKCKAWRSSVGFMGS